MKEMVKSKGVLVFVVMVLGIIVLDSSLNVKLENKVENRVFCFKKQTKKKISVLSQRCIYFSLYIPLSPFLGIETLKYDRLHRAKWLGPHLPGAAAFGN